MRSILIHPVSAVRLLLACAAVPSLLAGCGGSGGVLPGSAASIAQDRIMMVREEPRTFGYDRLIANCGAFPDLAVFVEREGVPDFMAETRNHGRQYLILYYLSRREAFACRDLPGRGGSVEFSGPYPVTDREFKMLDDFRRKQNG